MNKKIVIIGAGGHGKVVADIARKSGYTDIVFLDDNASVKEINGYPIAGTVKDVARFADGDFIVAIGGGSALDAAKAIAAYAANPDAGEDDIPF